MAKKRGRRPYKARKTARGTDTVPDWSRQERAAKREFERNRGRIEAGETFRGHKVESRKSPSTNKGGKLH